MKIDSSEIHIWFVDLNVEAYCNALTEFLSEDEYKRSCLFAFPHLKNRFIVARVNLRFILSHYIKRHPKNIEFCYGEYGKPALTGNNEIKFNLSHSGDWAVCAISLESEVGIDIEHVQEDIYSADMEQLCLSPNEQKALQSLPFAERMQSFYSLWTYKEALLKGLGCGLEYPITELEIDMSNNLYPKIKTDDLNLKNWSLYPFCYPKGYKGITYNLFRTFK